MKSTGNPLRLAGQGFQQPQPGQGDHRTYQSRTMGHPWLLLRKSISGWWKSTYPLKNDGVHQLGWLLWLFPIYGKIKTCSKPPTRHSTTNHVVSQYFLGGSCTFSLQPIHWWKTMKSTKILLMKKHAPVDRWFICVYSLAFFRFSTCVNHPRWCRISSIHIREIIGVM